MPFRFGRLYLIASQYGGQALAISTFDSEVVVLLSGGLDSACCLDFYKELGREVSGFHLGYGQPAEEQELQAATRIAKHYAVSLSQATWRGPISKTTGEIVGRNAFFIFAALMEAGPSVRTIALGVHSGTEYADCSDKFIRASERILEIYSPPNRSLGVPFLAWRKADIFAYAHARNVPIELAYSCEVGGEKPCGSCVSCIDMIELRANAG